MDESSNPQNIEDDWGVNFFDKSRIVSDEEMQTLWAKVLAGEANSPGTYSKRTVNFLGSLDKTDAQLFVSLCGFGWFIGEVTPLIFDVTQPIYNSQGINFTTLSHLDDIGLVSFGSLSGFQLLKLPQRIKIHYYGIPINLEFSKDADNHLGIGQVRLTKTGQQLAPICGSKPVIGFEDYVFAKWVLEGLFPYSPYPRGKTNIQ